MDTVNMSADTVLSRKDLMTLATQLTCSYLRANTIDLENVNSVMQVFMQMLSDMNRPLGSTRLRLPAIPAVPIEESVTEEYIVCLEDGKKLRMLKRHLNTVYKMTVEEYKERWGLDPDYPIVAPSYARRRSAIAKYTGLGKNGRRSKLKVLEGRSGAAVVGS